MNHELLHTWAAFLNELGLSSGAHWLAILRPSSGFGEYWGAYREFQYLEGGNYRAWFNDAGFIFNDLELYLMGLAGPSEVHGLSDISSTARPAGK
jgi:hypothetical protein